nr:hypothetical protein [uncultured Campylobacter sp.]
MRLGNEYKQGGIAGNGLCFERAFCDKQAVIEPIADGSKIHHETNGAIKYRLRAEVKFYLKGRGS